MVASALEGVSPSAVSTPTLKVDWEALLRDLVALGVQGAAVAGDLSRVAEVERVVDTAVARWGHLDVLVNNAGIWGSTPISVVSEAPTIAIPPLCIDSLDSEPTIGCLRRENRNRHFLNLFKLDL